MSFIFVSRDKILGEPSSFYFSYVDFLNNQASDADKRHFYLSLGSGMDDWWEETSPLVRQIYEKLLLDLTDWLHKHFFLNISEREVNILFGNLAHLFAKRVARAVAQASKFTDNYLATHSAEINDLDIKFDIPLSTSEALRQISSSEFGSAVERIALSHSLGKTREVNFELISREMPRVSREKKFTASKRVKESLYVCLQRLWAPLARTARYLVDGTYLGRLNTFLLAFRLRSFLPLSEFKKSPNLSELEPQRSAQIRSTEPLPQIILKLFITLLPVSLLEGAAMTRENARRIGYPQKASLAFTSNSYSSNDEFKLTVADSITRGMKYVVGQHGGDFGTSRITEICPEIEFSDHYLSWGWGSAEGNVISFGQIKPKTRADIPVNLSGVVLFLRAPYTNYVDFDMTYFNSHYYKKVEALLEELEELQIPTVLRFQTGVSEGLRENFASVMKQMRYVKMARNRPSLGKLIETGRLVVFTYDSTGMLELASSGLPFFLFAPDGIDLIRPKFTRNYERLRTAKLLSEQPIEAAQFLQELINDNGKLNSERITTAITHFSEGIVYYPTKKIRKLARLLSDLSPSQLRHE